MKYKWLICALAIFMLGSAQAWEDPQYISLENSIYWHANASCQGEFMLESDGTEGYFACPVCVQEDVEPKVTAVERGGTIILKMPDSWANSRTDIGSPFAARQPTCTSASAKASASAAPAWAAVRTPPTITHCGTLPPSCPSCRTLPLVRPASASSASTFWTMHKSNLSSR